MLRTQQHITKRLLLKAYDLYCWFCYPLYKKIEIESMCVSISDLSIVPPILFSQALLDGELLGKRILDIGTGCGIIALFAKKKRAAYVLGVDINDVAISNAETNLKNNFNDLLGIEFKQSDLYDKVNGQFDIIVSNPPFLRVPPLSKNDYKFCGGRMLEDLLCEGKEYLTPKGEIRILHPSSERSHLTRLSSKYGYVLQTLEYTPSPETLLLRLLLRLRTNPKLNMYIFKIHDADLVLH